MDRRFNLVRINLDALAHNLKEVRRLTGPAVQIMAVVKADAYGHGLTAVGMHLDRAGADVLGVMDLDEAVRLRDAGIEKPIVILAGITPGQCREIVELDITPFIYDDETTLAMSEAAAGKDRLASVFIKVDTGMNRLGVRHDRAHDFFSRVAGLKNIRVSGLATHFADADLKDGDFIDLQLKRLKDLISLARATGLDLPLNNAANSAAVLTMPNAHLQMVRPGLMLYGDYPAPHMEKLADLKPAMSVVSRVVQIKTVRAGETVSYGRTWTAPRDVLVAVVPVGYSHGYDRLLSNRGHALVRGRKAPVRGRVCMNMTMFDVTDIPEAAPGDEVVLLGDQDGGRITGREIADLCQTISYQVYCNIGSLNMKVYDHSAGI